MLDTPESIADGKLYYIRKCINDTLNDEQFLIYIRNIFKNVKTNNIVQYLWNYQSNFRFIPENNGDYCKDGMEFLKSKFGDCEDFVVFNSSILKLYGVRFRIKVTDTFNTGYYTHILIQYYDILKQNRVSFDGTYRIKGIGGEPISYKSRYYYI